MKSIKFYIPLVLAAMLCVVGAASAAPADDTNNRYTPTKGSRGSVPGVLIQQSSDGVNTTPINSTYPLPVSPVTTDPCQSPAVAKASVAISHTIDAELVAASGSQIVYVCGFNFTLNGTTPTARFVTGTGSICATGLTAKTGDITPSIGLNVLSAGGGYTVFSGSAGQALCIDLGGTGVGAQGVLTFVRK